MVFHSASNDFWEGLTVRFDELSSMSNWGSARDVETLAGRIFHHVVERLGELSNMHSPARGMEEMALRELDKMIAEREGMGWR